MTGEGQPGPKMPTSVKGLRALIAQAGLEYHHLIEKSELVDRAREAMVLINSSSRPSLNRFNSISTHNSTLTFL